MTPQTHSASSPVATHRLILPLSDTTIGGNQAIETRGSESALLAQASGNIADTALLIYDDDVFESILLTTTHSRPLAQKDRYVFTKLPENVLRHLCKTQIHQHLRRSRSWTRSLSALLPQSRTLPRRHGLADAPHCCQHSATHHGYVLCHAGKL